ncbi:MAG TPA: hybrid sensor histidine kinase/response regulator, partial [Vulgatibacter sp.]|nr:hybrid sensor histidine kinase/response regulator [Vulgatibacter sp.]
MGMTGRLGELTEKQQNAIAVCDRNADRLLRLINDLLLTARLEAGKMTLDPKALGVRSVLLEAANFLESDAEAAEVTFEVEAPEGEVFIRGSRDRLVEGFMHLFERGLRGKRDGERIRVVVEPRGRICSIRVELDGVHVPDAELPKLFQAFRTDGGPANVGLSIARRIIELHGGHVRAEQDEGGLRFLAALPLFAGAVSGVSEAPRPARGEILVVEDDDDCRNGIVEFLSGEGFEVRAFAEGKAALARIQGDAPPALVLLDLRIPGVDGAALIKAVREGGRAQRTPIYVISGAIDAGAGADEAWGERVDGVFEKPINFPYLLERVRELVEASPT